jgi:hypothetical protein
MAYGIRQHSKITYLFRQAAGRINKLEAHAFPFARKTDLFEIKVLRVCVPI